MLDGPSTASSRCKCDTRAYPVFTQTLNHPACVASNPAPHKIHYLTWIREHSKVKSFYPVRNNQKKFVLLGKTL